MAQVLTGQPSCPNCGARAAAQAEVCADCGYRFLEDRGRSRPPLRGLKVGVALAAAAVVASVLLVSRNDEEAPAVVVHRGPDLLSVHPLSNPAVERRLEARFTSALDDDTAGAHCGALQPRPAHAIRHCLIRYPGGSVRTVVVLTNPQGHELLVRP